MTTQEFEKLNGEASKNTSDKGYVTLGRVTKLFEETFGFKYLVTKVDENNVGEAIGYNELESALAAYNSFQ